MVSGTAKHESTQRFDNPLIVKVAESRVRDAHGNAMRGIRIAEVGKVVRGPAEPLDSMARRVESLLVKVIEQNGERTVEPTRAAMETQQEL